MSIKFKGWGPIATNQSAAANYVSNPILIDMINAISFDVDWTGGFSGTFFVEASNALQDQTQMFPEVVPATVIWKPIQSVVIAAGVTPDMHTYWFIDSLTSARFVRFRFAFTSGTGSFNCIYHAKSYG